MMKKICLLVLVMVLGKMWSYAQYPVTQYIGTDSAVVISKGALQSRLINQVYSDTTQANTQRIRQYPGAQIVTNGAGMKIWLRNNTATAWLQIPAGSGVGNIYTIDGTLSGNRTLSGGTNSLTFQGLSNFNVTTTDSVRLANSQQYFILSDTLAKLERAGKATILVNSLNGGARIVLNPTGPADERKYEINAQNEEFWIAQISDSEALGDTIFFVNATGKVGIGTTSPDSLLTVNGGINAGSLRLTNLATSPGTKQLRINAQGQISLTDTLIDAGGTVTSVATNNGSGITGGPITTTGTLAIDTTIISTKANVSGGLAGKLNISDTATMLQNYVNSAGYGLGKSGQTVYADSAALSNYYLRRKDSLTATNLLGYVTKTVLADTAAAIRSADAGGTVTSVATNNGTGITGGTITTTGTLAIDTLLISTRAWRQKGVDSLQANINTKLNISDTATMLQNYANNVGYGLSKTGQVIVADSATLSNYYLRRKDSLTATNLLGYVTRTVLADTAAAIRGADAGGTVTSVATNNGTGITGGTITTTGTLAIDTLLISTRAWRQKGIDSLQANINQKLNISDTASMLANYITGPQTFSSYFAKFNGNGTIDTSRIYQNNGLVGVNTTGPSYNLDVLGTLRSTSNSYFATGGGVVGIGSNSADSMLSVTQGVLLQRGVRMSALPQAPGTKALRIDASGTISYADTLIDAGGTVTSVATNNGTGITGGTITTTGTLAIDTLLISTRAWRQKGVDSLQANINTKLNISDTATMLQNYANNVGYGLSKTGQVIVADSATLSNYYLRRKDSLTATNLLGYVTRTVLADTAAAIRGADAGGTVTSVATNNGSGITGGTITTTGTLAIDTLLISTRAWRQKGIDSVASLINTNVSGTTNYVSKFTGTNTIGNSQIFDNGTAVGISTITPESGYKLDVNGNIKAKNEIKITGRDSDGIGTLYFDSNTGTFSYLNIVPSSNEFRFNIVPSAGLYRFMVNNTNRLLVNSSGVGVGTTSIDSILTVSGGANFSSGVRMSGLPTAVGTKALRVDASGTLSITDTLVDAGGTVTSVATNNGSGITGGTITTSGTLAIDTLLISTRLWRQKGIDSVQGNLTTGLALKVNISDTATMLSPYARTNVVNAGLALKVNISDTASMLTPYLRKVDTTAMLSPYKTYYPRTAISLTTTGSSGAATYNNSTGVLNIPIYTDAYTGTVTSVATNNGTGITGGTITTSGTLAIDTLLISTRAWRQKGVDSVAGLLSGYVPTSRTLTINGTSYDLSANRSWSVGTVTSVATNTGTGITGGTITGSGTIAADTLLLSTRAWRQKGIDSVAALINSNVSGTTNYVAKFTGTNTIGNSVIYESGGSIGIGTTSMGNAGTINLAVGVPATSAGGLQLWASPTQTHYVQFGDGTSGADTYRGFLGYIHSSDAMIFGANASEQMRLTSTGLGIGTSSPAYKLDVSGTSNITSSAYFGGLVQMANNKEFQIKDASGNAQNILFMFTDNNVYLSSPVSGSSLIFRGVGYTERMRLDASGNLGLGTSSPDASFKFTISGNSGTVAPGIYFNDEASSPTNYTLYTNGSKNFTLRNQSTSNNIAVFTPSGNLGLGVTPSAWTSIDKAIEIGKVGNSIYGGGINDITLTANAYFSSGWKYGSTGSANLFSVGYANNSFVWLTAPSGTAGNAISFTQAMTLDASGRLGIGTTSPAYKLVVSGGSSEGAISIERTTVGTNTVIGALNFTNNNAGTVYGRVRGGRNTAGDGYVSLGTGVGDNLYAIEGGNVGIGTTSPAATLDVNGTIYSRSASGIFSDVVTAYSGVDLTLVYGGSGNLLFKGGSGAATRMTLNASGNLGLGVTPSAWSGLKAIQVENGSLAGWTSDKTAVYLSANLYFDGSDFRYISSNSAGHYRQQAGYHSWFTIPSGTAGAVATLTERMRLDASGNLGLGVTPSAWSAYTALQIKNSAYYAYTTSGIHITGVGSNIYYDGSQNTYIANGFASSYLQLSGEHRFYTAASGTAGNAISFTQAMTLDASGRLGIGTTSPSYKLDVVGQTSLSAGSSQYNLIQAASGYASGFQFFRSGYNNWYIGSTNNSVDFAIGESLSSPSIFFKSGGNVGIGTTSPAQILHLSSTTPVLRIDATAAYNASPTATLSFVGTYNSGGGLDGFANITAAKSNTTSGDGSAYLAFSTNTSTGTMQEKMRITSGGNVGIGTTSPRTNTTIKTSGNNGSTNYITFNPSGNKGIELEQQSGTANFGNTIWFNNDELFAGIGGFRPSTSNWGTDLRFYTHPDATTNQYDITERMRITSGGNVLVGTTTDAGYKLDIAGSSRVSTVLSINGSSVPTDRMLEVTGNVSGKPFGVVINPTFTYTGTNVFGIYAGNNFNTGTITNSYNLYIESTSVGSATVTNKYGIYQVGSGDKNYFAGNVGIGSSSPSALLHLNASNVANRGQLTIQSGDFSQISFYKGATTTTDLVAHIYSQNTGNYDFNINNYTSTGAILFGTNGSTERMRITSGGELLINTTSDAGDYKLQVNGAVLATNYSTPVTASNGYYLLNYNTSNSSSRNWKIANDVNTYGDLGLQVATTQGGSTYTNSLILTSTDATFIGSIKTAAPSGGTAKNWKLGAAGVTLGGSNLSGVEVEIDGTTYYLVTGYLPEPEPEAVATAGPSGDTYSTKYEKPAIKTSPNTQKIKELEAEVAELKAMMKTLMNQKKK